MSNLTDYIKTAFEYKEAGDYKGAIDFFYKALTIESDSCEIMSELADLYTLLSQDDRALSFYEQIILKNNHNELVCYKYALLLKKLKKYDEAKTLFVALFHDEYNLQEVAKELFEIYVAKQEFQELINIYNLKYNKLSDTFIFYFVGLAYEKIGREQLAEDFFIKAYDMAKNNVKAGISIVGLLFEYKKYEEAKELAFDILQYSENDRLFYYIAEVEFMTNDIDAALKHYSYAIKLNNKCALYFFKLGLAYTLKGYNNEAEESYCNALLLDTENKTYNYALAYLYYTTGKYLLAEKIVDSILEVDEEYTLAVALKVMLEIENDRIVFCNHLIQKLINAKEKDDFAYYVLSKYYDKLAMWKKALKYIEMAIDLNEYSIDYKFEYAQYFFNSNQFDESIRVCSDIINIKPKYLPAYVLLGQNYLVKNDYSLAYDNAKIALSLDANSSEAQEILGKINISKCAYEKAIENFKIATLISPQRVNNYVSIAECYFNLGEYEEAYSYYKEASLIEVSEAEYYYYMAKCSIKLDNKENALANFSIMHRLAPFNVNYMCDYACYLSQNSKKKLAIDVLKKCLKALKEAQDRQKIEECIKNIKKK